MNYDYLYRVVIFGDSDSGKTSFMNKYISNEQIRNYLPTIGVDFGVKNMKAPDNKIIKLHIWDTSGQPNFRHIVRSYFGGVAGAVLIYDKSDASSFQRLPDWIHDFNSVNDNLDIPLIVVGTKTDLPPAVLDTEIEHFLGRYNVLYDEVNLNTRDDMPDVLVPLWETIWKKFIVEDNACLGVKIRANLPTTYVRQPPVPRAHPGGLTKVTQRASDFFQSKCIIT